MQNSSLSKKKCRDYVQMLRCFKSAHSLALSKGLSTIYEAHMLIRNDSGSFSKVFRYYLPGQVLPELDYDFFDIFIDVLNPETIKHYVEECEELGIQ